MLITGQDLCHRLGSSTYIKNAYTSYSLLPTGTSAISRACTHDNFFMTCSDNSGTQHERFVQICASLCSFKRGSLLMLISEQALGYRIGSHAYKKRTHTYRIRLLLAVVSPISRVCTHEYFFITCSAHARTRHKRLSRFYASLCSFKSASLLIPGTWKARKPHIYKKRTHTQCIRSF